MRRRLEIQVVGLIVVLLGYLGIVILLSTYECFEDTPVVAHRVCNTAFWLRTEQWGG